VQAIAYYATYNLVDVHSSRMSLSWRSLLLGLRSNEVAFWSVKVINQKHQGFSRQAVGLEAISPLRNMKISHIDRLSYTAQLFCPTEMSRSSPSNKT
jgi:hypothetical protein